MKTTAVKLALLMTTVGLVSGCVSTGAKRTEKVDSAVGNTRVGLEQSKALIGETLATLNSLQLESTVLADVYPVFKKEVKAVADSAEKVKKNSAALQDAGKVKFDAWKLQLESIQDETLKKSSQKGMNEALKKHEDLLKLLKESETVMDPFVSDLNDIVTYLDLDLTREGIKKISGLNGPIRKAVRSGKDVQKWIDKVVEELTEAQGTPSE